MAKKSGDKSNDTPKVFTPPTADVLSGSYKKYRELKAEKKPISDKQKQVLDDLATQNAVPPFVSKFLMKLQEMDEGPQTNAVRATIHGLKTLRLAEQTDAFDTRDSVQDDLEELDGDDEGDEVDASGEDDDPDSPAAQRAADAAAFDGEEARPH